jgi:hypothetical protein
VRRRAALLGLTLVVACEGSAIVSETPQGILAGQVTVGPNCPVEMEDEPCPPPPGTFESIRVLVYTAGGDERMATVHPGSDGHFELRLPVGIYRVVLEHTIGLPGTPPEVREARVDAGLTTTIAFDVDTGIR